MEKYARSETGCRINSTEMTSKHRTCIFLKAICRQGQFMSESPEMSASGLVAAHCLFGNIFISVCACKIRNTKSVVTAMLQQRNSFLSPTWFASNLGRSMTFDIFARPSSVKPFLH